MFQSEDRITGTNKLVSLPWGAQQKKDFCLFRLFCPRALNIDLVLFDHYEQRTGEYHPMEKLDDGSWQLTLPGYHTGKYYAYRIHHPQKASGLLRTRTLIADPWSTHITTTNHYNQHSRSQITEPEPFDWEGDTFVIPEKHRELIIYETHLKDLTSDPSAGAKHPGTYQGFIETGITGGINHLKRLGVNAVEFLPLHKFAGFEPPFRQKTSEGYYNTWNPYSRNYWGYMTSFYFVPETMYASDGSVQPGAITGKSPAASYEFKQLVKALHKEGISVIMDVVYNHVSNYDFNPLKYMDKSEFFRMDKKRHFTSESGCGNDLRTESPHIRELIISSIQWWMQEYHIDGFRFDMANLIDSETISGIREQARQMNPDVLLIAEPWGGGYDPVRFSENGWSAWNDQIRNGVKGYDPVDSPGFIFGKWHHETQRESLENYIKGTLINKPNGRFHQQEHTVNYLECHDGYTLGDFIRIALDPAKKTAAFNDKSSLIALNEQELRCSRLAALFLMTSQGIPMIHAGQEWGRSKWIVPENKNDPNAGKLDHNSYEKGNRTNYLDFNEIEANISLFNYYQGLIQLRKSFPQLRLAEPHEISFHDSQDALHLTYEIQCKTHHPDERLLVSLNGNPHKDHKITLPEGKWEIIADANKVSLASPLPVHEAIFTVPGTSGVILRSSGAP
ncbi:MAG: alpha-amylase family glycosyl hydrolase [Balneolales bacterium]